MKKRKPNPILAAIELRLKGQRPTVIMDGWDAGLPPLTQRTIVQEFFTAKTIYQVGTLVVGAILAGDKRMIGTVREAIKAGDHLFKRDREIALLRAALYYRLRWDLIRGDSKRSVEELKKGFEEECNHGKQLEPHQWQRLRIALNLPKRRSVRHDRKPVNSGEVGEIIHLAPSLKKKRTRWKVRHEKAQSVS